MSNKNYPRLCGGTFFTLLLQALKQKMSAREHYNSNCDGLTDPEVLGGLIQVANPDYTFPGKERLKTPANNYKSCKMSSCVHLPFDDDQLIQALDSRVRSNYESARSSMISFVNKYLDLGESVGKATNLVKALVDLIQQDFSIAEDEEFYIGEEGQKIKKAAFGDLSNVCLPAFLLGIWHYIIVNRRDNTVGKDTYNKWCPSTGGGVRKYTANMGSSILRDLYVYMPKDPERVEPTDDNPSTEMDSTSVVSNPINLQPEAPVLPVIGVQEIPPNINYDYFNLFVLGSEEIDKPYFLLERKDCLHNYTGEDIKKHFGTLTPEVIEEIKTFPSIFIKENLGTRSRALDNQYVIYGFVKDVQPYFDTVQFQFFGYQTRIPQQRVNELKYELMLYDDRPYNEFTETHWAIKRADLLQRLYDAGLTPSPRSIV